MTKDTAHLRGDFQTIPTRCPMGRKKPISVSLIASVSLSLSVHLSWGRGRGHGRILALSNLCAACVSILNTREIDSLLPQHFRSRSQVVVKGGSRIGKPLTPHHFGLSSIYASTRTAVSPRSSCHPSWPYPAALSFLPPFLPSSLPVRSIPPT